MSVQVSSCATSTCGQPLLITKEVRHNRPVHCACNFWQMKGKVNEEKTSPHSLPAPRMMVCRLKYPSAWMRVSRIRAAFTATNW
jgi:hypothetical protein